MSICTLEELLERLNTMPISALTESLPVVQERRNLSDKLSSTELKAKIKRGENWHTNLVQLVAHLVGRNWSDEEILAMADDLTLANYEVDQTIKEMTAMIVGARKKWHAPNPQHSIIDPVSLIAINLGDFLGLNIPPREMIVTPIIPSQGLVMLYAARGIGKTFVGLSIALAIATGTSTLGNRWVATKCRRVLLVDGEMPAITLQERLKSMTPSFPPVEADYLRIITPDYQECGIPDIATQEGQLLIEEHMQGVELVILDNLSSLLRNDRENEAESWIPLQGWLLSLRRRGISVLIIHHAGKGGNQRGTSKREDLLDTVIVLKRPENYDPKYGAQFEVHYEKARGFFGDDAKAFEARLNCDQSGLGWEVKDIEDALAEQVKALRAEGTSQRNIAAQLGTSAATVNRILKKQDLSLTPKQEEIEF